MKRASVWFALFVALMITALVIPTALPFAQQLPPGFNEALADLSRRVGRTLTLEDFNNRTSRWEWRGVDFADNTLECPQTGETVTPGTVTGYQIIFVLRGRKYDYRVPLNNVSALRLCTNPTGAVYDLPPAPTAEVRTDPPPELNNALTDLNRRLELNLTLDDFDSPTSRWSWRWREFTNSQLNCPAAGQATDRIITGGWQFIFVYQGRTFDYRMKFNDPESLFLCRGG